MAKSVLKDVGSHSLHSGSKGSRSFDKTASPHINKDLKANVLVEDTYNESRAQVIYSIEDGSI